MGLLKLFSSRSGRSSPIPEGSVQPKVEKKRKFWERGRNTNIPILTKLNRSSHEASTRLQDGRSVNMEPPTGEPGPEAPPIRTSIDELVSSPPGAITPPSEIMPIGTALVVSSSALSTTVIEDGDMSRSLIPPLVVTENDQPTPRPSTGVEPPSLWDKAWDKLAQEDRDILSSSSDKLNCLELLLDATKTSRQQCIKNRLKFKFKGKDIILRDVADKLLVWVEKFKEVGDVAVQYDTGHAALPWALFRFLLQVTLNEQENMAVVLLSTEEIGKLLLRCRVYEEYFIHPNASYPRPKNYKSLDETLVEIYAAVLEFLVSAKKMFTRSTLGNIGFGIFHSLEPMFDRIRHFERELEVEMSIACEQSRRAEHQILIDLEKTLEKPIFRMDDSVQWLKRQFEDSRKREMLEWLSTIPCETFHGITKHDIMESTCHWLLGREEFCNWRISSSSEIFWLRGPPGVGKTKLTCSVIEKLLESNEPVAYFYCNRGDQSRQSSSAIVLSTFVKQLCLWVSKDAIDAIPDPVATIYEGREKNPPPQPLLFHDSSNLLQSLANLFPRITLVIDALDECEPSVRRELLEAIRNLMEATSLVKVFISSRNEVDINRALQHTPSISVDADKNSKDISLFIHDKVDSFINRKELLSDVEDNTRRVELRDKIIKTLNEKASGMFLWVNLQIERLRDIFEGDIEDVLKSLPRSLNGTYQYIYEQLVSKQERYKLEAVRCALIWIICSLRPLTKQEWVDATRLTVPEAGNFTFSTLYSLCQNFVFVSDDDELLRFTHLSVREYFEDDAGPFSRIDLHCMVAKWCFRCLDMQYQPDEGPKLKGLLGDTQQRFLDEYIKFHWPDHLINCSEDTRKYDTVGFLSFFGTYDSPRKAYIQWVVSHGARWWSSFSHDTPSIELQNQLAIAAYLPFENVLRKLCEAQRSCAAGTNNNHKWSAPLLTAAAFGRLKNMEILLENSGEANVNTTNTEGESALIWAVRNGHINMVRFLIEKRADVNMAAKDGKSPLYWAAYQDNMDMVRFLVENGSDVNNGDKNGESPLYRAAYQDNMDMVRFLVENGSDVNKVDEYGWSPLYQAACEGNMDMVRFLVENGADVNKGDKNGESPLYRAACQDNTDTVRFLVENGADVNKVDKNGESPLYRPAYQDNMDMARFLVENGADVNKVDKDGASPLYRAAYENTMDIVRFLVENGADVNKVNENGKSPLYWAACQDNMDMVRFLVENGSDVNKVGKNGWSPLYWAAFRDNMDMVRFLVENGADVNKVDKNGRSPLYWAAFRDNMDMVRFLVENGADVNKVDKDGKSPLHRAAYRDNMDMVRFLVENGADVNKVDEHGWSPLYWVAYQDNMDRVRYLVEIGVEDKDSESTLS